MRKYSLLFFLVVCATVVFGQLTHNPNYVVYKDGPDVQLNSGVASTCAPGCLPKPGACTYYRYFADGAPFYEPSMSCDFAGTVTVYEQSVLRKATAAGSGCVTAETVSLEGQFTVTGVNFVWTTTPPSSCTTSSSINLSSYISYSSGTIFTGTGVSGNVFYPNIAGAGNHTITALRVFDNGTASRTVTIRVYGPVQISTQPVSKTVCPGSFNFSVVATANNPPLTYQWQSSPNGTTWTDITNAGVYSGATTGSLSFNGATSSLEGYHYRVVLQDACGASGRVTSGAATLSFNTPVSYSQQPLGQSACGGTQATFTAVAAGTGLTYQWQASNTGINWVDLAEGLTYTGTKTASLKVLSDNSLNAIQYRLATTGTCGTYFSGTATLTVTTGPNITSSPTPVTACEGTSASFTVVASGSGLSYQWQFSASGGAGTFADISGATTATYTRTSLVSGAAGYYRAMVKSSCGSTATPSGSAQLTINAAARISIPPDDGDVCSGGNIQFAATGEGFGSLSYQWEVSTNGGTSYSSLANSTLYAGVTSTTLRITGATAAINKYRYRIRVTGTCGTAPSAGATLTVNAYPGLPTVSNPSRCGTGILAATATSTAASPTYRWYTNATDATPVYTGATYTLSNLTSTTAFHVSVVAAGCESNKMQMTFTRYAPQNVPLGSTLTLCSGQGSYNLENDIESEEAKGSNFTWTGNGTNFTSKNFDPAVGAGAYVLSYSPPASAQAVPYCFTATTRNVTVISSASGDGGITFVHPSIYNGAVMNMCIGDSPIDLTSLPSVRGGSWSAISGGGLSYSANAVIFTPNQSSYTAVEPNVFRYTLQVNGCTATKDLSVFVKDNQSVPVVSGVPALVCPGQQLALVASVVTPGTFSYNWYKAGQNIPFATTSNLAFPVTGQETLQVRSLNGSFGCLSAAKVLDIVTPFSSGTVSVDKRNVNAGDFVAFSTDASENGNTFLWNFGDGATSMERNPTHYFYTPGVYKIILNVNSNLGCSQAIVYESVTVGGEPINVITATDPVEEGTVHISPNPVTSKINIKTDSEILSYRLYDQRGHIVPVEKMSGTSLDLNLSADELPAGMYVLHVRTKMKSLQFKLFKQ